MWPFGQVIGRLVEHLDGRVEGGRVAVPVELQLAYDAELRCSVRQAPDGSMEVARVVRRGFQHADWVFRAAQAVATAPIDGTGS